jgi:hypothetical protein
VFLDEDVIVCVRLFSTVAEGFDFPVTVVVLLERIVGDLIFVRLPDEVADEVRVIIIDPVIVCEIRDVSVIRREAELHTDAEDVLEIAELFVLVIVIRGDDVEPIVRVDVFVDFIEFVRVDEAEEVFEGPIVFV